MTITSIIDSDNIHAEQTRQGLHHLKELTASLDSWDLTLDQDGVKLYDKKLDDTNLPPLVRGDTILTDLPPGCTPLAVATVATLPGCRKVWDEKYDQSEIKEYYTRYESLFWVKMKAPWPISPRDFSATSIRDVVPNVTYCSMISVQDDNIPDTWGTVRGKLLLSGWKICTVENDQIGITYVNQVDLAGWVPASFLKKLLLEIPLCAGKVRDYISQYGFVPTSIVDKSLEFSGESFDHDARKYTLELVVGDGGSVETLCSAKMYGKGVQVNLKGEGSFDEKKDQHNNPFITFKHLKGPIHIIIEAK